MVGTGSALTLHLHRWRRERPGAMALVFGERCYSWTDLLATVVATAGSLRRQGIGPGVRVAMLASNDDRYLIAILATLWSGGVAVPLNARWSAAEIEEALADCTPALMLVDGLRPDVSASVPTARIDDLVADEGAEVADAGRAGDDLALLMYTGGTTGRSKGVMISHAGLTASVASYATFDGGIGDTMLAFAPMFHIAGINAAFGGLMAGCRQIYLAGFDPAAVLSTIERYRVTDMFAVPTMLQMLIDHADFAVRDTSSLRHLAYGASPITETLLTRLLAVMPGVRFIQAYGMTELSPVATLLAPEDHLHPEHRHSAGRSTFVTEVRIVGPDDTELPRGQIGEIVVRGANVMPGYWGRPDATAEALRGGWMHTGDLGRMDADGYVYVVDRLKDMIVTGGENVYSVEVERALSSHPDVALCAVIGVPDPAWGESVHAVIVPRTGSMPDLHSIQSHCRRHIAGFKLPRSIELRSEMPLTAAGKILKTALRDGR